MTFAFEFETCHTKTYQNGEDATEEAANPRRTAQGRPQQSKSAPYSECGVGLLAVVLGVGCAARARARAAPHPPNHSKEASPYNECGVGLLAVVLGVGARRARARAPRPIHPTMAKRVRTV